MPGKGYGWNKREEGPCFVNGELAGIRVPYRIHTPYYAGYSRIKDFVMSETPQQTTLKVNGLMEFSGSGKTSTEIQINKMPKIEIDSGVDVTVILGAAVTIVTIIASTLYSISSFRNSLKNQKEIANQDRQQAKEAIRAEILSRNRQEWINSLRDTTSEFIAGVMKIVDLHALKDGTAQAHQALNTQNPNDYALEWCVKLHEAKSTAVSLRSKIHLLANPAEAAFKEFLPLIDKLYEEAVDNKGTVNDLTLKVFEAAQNILKKEWERVKDLEGLGSDNSVTKRSAHN